MGKSACVVQRLPLSTSTSAVATAAKMLLGNKSIGLTSKPRLSGVREISLGNLSEEYNQSLYYPFSHEASS